MTLSTARPKKIIPSPVRSIIQGAPQARPQQGKPKYQPKRPKPPVLPDGWVYEAVGVIHAELKVWPHRAELRLPDGGKLKIVGIRDQGLMLWLLSNTNTWQGKACDWVVWPGRYGFSLVALNQTENSLQPGQFRIAGHLKRLETGNVGVMVRRNDPRDKSFSAFSIEGELPGLIDGSLWRLTCELGGGKLHIIGGEAVK